MSTISILWLIFALLFLSFAIFHFRQARKHMPYFQLTKRPGAGTVRVCSMDIDQPIIDLSNDLNSYIAEFNRSNKIINIIQGIGYLSAFFTALLSMYLTIADK
jgi:hypothetical protein